MATKSFNQFEPQSGALGLGQKLLNRYEIFGIREGGFGIVYLVTDIENGKEFAIKTFKPEYSKLTSSIEEFKSEIAFWINLDPHPNVVKAHFVKVIHEQPYLFVEYVDGGSLSSLRDWLRRGPLVSLQAISFAYQLCLAMEFANQNGEIAHLDLKPENILISREQVLKVTDFGLARQIRIIQGRFPSINAGTWLYAAPEQIMRNVVNTQSDIYAFGIILYEMLTGKLPYPFEPAKTPDAQFGQLLSFHQQRGTDEICSHLYYSSSLPGKDLISSCITHAQADRLPTFKEVRKLLEYEFRLTLTGASDSNSILPEADLFQRATNLQQIGRDGEALSIYNVLLRQTPNRAEIWLGAALALLKTGQKDTARTFLIRAIELDSNLKVAKDLLASI